MAGMCTACLTIDGHSSDCPRMARKREADLRAENERLRETEKAAHFLLTWTYQASINCGEMPERGWWHVKDLHPSVWNVLNAAERDLYHELMKETRAALEGK